MGDAVADAVDRRRLLERQRSHARRGNRRRVLLPRGTVRGRSARSFGRFAVRTGRFDKPYMMIGAPLSSGVTGRRQRSTVGGRDARRAASWGASMRFHLSPE